MPYDEDEIGYIPRSTGMGVTDPAALAVAALVLGALSLGGFGLLNGSNYIYPLAQGRSSTTAAVLSGLLGAAIAVVPVVLGSLAAGRTHPGDPGWVSGVARAGVLVGGLACVLRLVATAIAAVQVADSGYAPPL